MLSRKKGNELPKNNLEEQLARHNSKKQMTLAPKSNDTTSFKKLSCSTLTPQQGHSRISFTESPVSKSSSLSIATSYSTPSNLIETSGISFKSGNENLGRPPLRPSPLSSKKRELPEFLKPKWQVPVSKATVEPRTKTNFLTPSRRNYGSEDSSIVPTRPVTNMAARDAQELTSPSPLKSTVPVAYVTPVVSRTTNSRTMAPSSCPEREPSSWAYQPPSSRGNLSLPLSPPDLNLSMSGLKRLPIKGSFSTSTPGSSLASSYQSPVSNNSIFTSPSAPGSKSFPIKDRLSVSQATPESSTSISSPAPGSSLARSCPSSSNSDNLFPPQPAPLSTVAFSSVTSKSPVSSTSHSTAKDIQDELDSSVNERLSLMDDICSLLSEHPPSEITAFFKHSAGDMQKKLAIRKKLLNKEKELKRQLHAMSSPVTDEVYQSSSSMSMPCGSVMSSTSSSMFAQTTYTPQITGVTSPPAAAPAAAPAAEEWEDVYMDDGVDENEVDDLLAAEAEEFGWNADVLWQSIDEPDFTDIPAATPRPVTVFSTPISTTPIRTTSSPVSISASPSSAISSNKKSTFKPPFLQPKDSVKSTCGQRPAGFKPPPRDDSSEFRGQYDHAREMYKIFNQVFGLKKFRPNQLEAVNAVVLGRDAFILMPTGGGKSLCYQLPALMLPGVTVVVSPLRSLIQDQVQKLTSLGIPAKHLSSDLTLSEENEVYTSLSRRDPVTKLLYVTPEKLSASNRLVSALQALHNRQRLARFVIDEAHCISQWGHDFRPDYKKLSELRHKFPGTPTVALTATATPRVRTDILHQLHMHMTCKWFTQSFDRVNLRYAVVPKKPKKVTDDIVELISSNFSGQSGIVYCLSKKDCEHVAEDLRRGSVAAFAYHAGMSDGDRSMVQQRWLQEDGCKVVCATIAFGMGIDKPGVRFVIHHSLPKSMEGYYQEAGRAGRDGDPAQCILFYSYSDMARLRRMIKREELRYEQEKVHLENLLRMVQYCENETDCRRVQLLEYFAESYDPRLCKNGSTPCDNCQSQVPFVSENVTDLVRVIVESVQMAKKNQFTLNQYLDALKGSSSSSKLASGVLTRLPLYKVGSARTKHDLERLLHMLVMKDILSESMHIGAHDNVVCYVQAGSKARDVQDGKITEIILKVKRQKGSVSTSKSNVVASDSREDQLKPECYKALCRLRLAIANKFKLKNPEYILSSASLQAMSRLLPTTKEELLAVEGYTEVRWSRFEGEEFLKITQQYSQEVAKITKAGEGSATSPGSSSCTETTSVYFQRGGVEQQRPVIGKGKRKKVNDGPKPKRPALPILDFNSEDEFEQNVQRRVPQLMPHPNH